MTFDLVTKLSNTTQAWQSIPGILELRRPGQVHLLQLHSKSEGVLDCTRPCKQTRKLITQPQNKEDPKELQGMPWIQDQLSDLCQSHQNCDGPEHAFLLSGY